MTTKTTNNKYNVLRCHVNMIRTKRLITEPGKRYNIVLFTGHKWQW